MIARTPNGVGFKYNVAHTIFIKGLIINLNVSRLVNSNLVIGSQRSIKLSNPTPRWLTIGLTR